MKTLISFLFAIIYTASLLAQIPDTAIIVQKKKAIKGTFNIALAQDFLVDWWPNKNFDRNYTQGTSFAYSKPGLQESLLFLPLNLLLKLNDKIRKPKHGVVLPKIGPPPIAAGPAIPFPIPGPPSVDTVSSLDFGLADLNEPPFEGVSLSPDAVLDETRYIEYPATIAMGVTAFTPRVIDSETPVVGDRPFGNVFFLTTQRYRVRDAKTFVKTSLSYGIIGSNIANTFQSYAHQSIVPGRPTEISWDHQISNGGAFAFLFSHQTNRTLFNVSHNLKKKYADDPRSATVIRDSLAKETLWRISGALGFKFDAGWYFSLASPLSFRFGKFSKYSITDLNIPLIVADYKGGLSEYPKRKEFFGFAAITPRVTPHNSLILGQPFVNTEYTLPNEDYNPMLIDIKYGLVFSFLRLSPDENNFPLSRWDIVLSINHRSSEIRNKTYKRWHHWGEVSINFPLF